jgi:hypothetical protein
MLGQAIGDFAGASSRKPNAFGLNVEQCPDAIMLLLHNPGVVVFLQLLSLAFIEVTPVIQQHRHDLSGQSLTGLLAFPVIPLKNGDVGLLAGSPGACDVNSQCLTFGLEFSEILQEWIPWDRGFVVREVGLLT